MEKLSSEVTETTSPQSLKIFTVWLFTRKFANPQISLLNLLLLVLFAFFKLIFLLQGQDSPFVIFKILFWLSHYVYFIGIDVCALMYEVDISLLF